jgi:hypothetical protein
MITEEALEEDKIVLIGRVFFAIGLFGIGAQHFIFSDFNPVIVAWWPPGFPRGPHWLIFSGQFSPWPPY